MNVFHEDGRAFIEQSQEKWDYLVHDVFTGGSVPAHLFTVEMWSAVKGRISEDGVIVVVSFPVCLILTRTLLARWRIRHLSFQLYSTPLSTAAGSAILSTQATVQPIWRYSAPPPRSRSASQLKPIFKDQV